MIYKEEQNIITLSAYFSEELDKRSERSFDQRCVHLINFSLDAGDESEALNSPELGYNSSDPKPWQSLPAFCRNDWKRVYVTKLGESTGLIDCLKSNFRKAFDTPAIQYDICDTISWYAKATAGEVPLSHFDRWGMLLCLDRMEAKVVSDVFTNSNEDRFDDVQDFLMQLFQHKIDRTVGSAFRSHIDSNLDLT